MCISFLFYNFIYTHLHHIQINIQIVQTFFKKLSLLQNFMKLEGGLQAIRPLVHKCQLFQIDHL